MLLRPLSQMHPHLMVISQGGHNLQFIVIIISSKLYLIERYLGGGGESNHI